MTEWTVMKLNALLCLIFKATITTQRALFHYVKNLQRNTYPRINKNVNQWTNFNDKNITTIYIELVNTLHLTNAKVTQHSFVVYNFTFKYLIIH